MRSLPKQPERRSSISKLTSSQGKPRPIYFSGPMAGKLDLPAAEIDRCRALARTVAEGLRPGTERYTTVSTERTVLRLLGVDGVDADEVPIPNRAVDALQKAGRLARGAAVWVGSAMAGGAADPSDAARRLTESGGTVPEHPR